MFTLTKVVVIATLLAVSTSAEGINCEGSGECGSGGGGAISSIISLLQDQVNAGNGENFFYNEDQIVCTGNICAYFQNNGQNGNVNLALDFAQQIQGHGCLNCGSVPTMSGNDVSTGELTINYVETDCCNDGNCYCSQYAISSTPLGEPCQGCF